MKIFKLVTGLVGLTAATAVSSRVRRDTVAYSLSGEENPDELMNILSDLASGEQDDLEQLIRDIMAADDRDRSLSDDQIRKFRNLKILVLWLQKEKKFGRYCFYGCYCLPEGSHNIAAGGYGRPLDGIDQACFDFKKCYQCLIDEHEAVQPNREWNGQTECRGENIGYRANLLVDGNGKNYIECTNKLGECRRNICECDKALAEKLSAEEDNWDESKHEIKGGFDREANCHKPVGGGSPFVECCGNNFDFPLNQPRRENQCCDAHQAKPAGTC